MLNNKKLMALRLTFVTNFLMRSKVRIIIRHYLDTQCNLFDACVECEWSQLIVKIGRNSNIVPFAENVPSSGLKSVSFSKKLCPIEIHSLRNERLHIGFQLIR